MKLLAATIVGAGLLATACSTDGPAKVIERTVTVTVTPAVAAPKTTAAAPTTRAQSGYSGDGVFSVGDQPSGGARAAIRPGRYTITMTDPSLGALAVVRCSALPCSASENFLGADSGYGAEYTSVIDILDTDGAVRLMNARLTPV